MNSRRRLSISSLMWGLIFAAIGGFGLWVGLGRPVDWALISFAAPSTLILVGLVGLLVSRTRT